MSSHRRRSRKSQPAAPAVRGEWKQLAPAGFLLLALTVIVYLPVMRGGFIWDDDLLITANRWITAAGGLPGIWRGQAGPDYLPVTSTFFWVEWRLWGMNAAGYHGMNILLHAAAVLLFWRLLARLRIPGAWLAAALFAVHPVAVGSVAWIAEGKNTLALLLGLLSFHLYLRSETGRRPLCLLSLIAFAAALLSKSAVVMLPCVFLLYRWWKDLPFDRKDIIRLIPFFLLSLADAAITIRLQAARAISGAVIPIGGPIERIESAAVATSFYLSKALLPVHLSIIYAPPSGILRWLAAGFGVAFWIALLILAWKVRTHWARGAVFGFGSFILLLLPVLGLFKMYYFIFAPVADHLQYIALPACLATVAAALAQVLPAPRWHYPKVAAFALVLIALGFMTWSQAALYVDGRTLWTYAARSNPQSFAAHFAYGAQLSAAGQPAEARQQYELAVKMNPRFLKARLNLAILLDKMGRPDESIRQYHQAIELQPDVADSHMDLAVVLLHHGQINEAIGQFREALRLNPANAVTHNDLGSALQDAGKPTDAIGEFETAVALDPDYPDARSNLGLAFFNSGNPADAVTQLKELTRLRPDSADAHNDLGSALYLAGRADEALAEYRQALQIDPANPKARQNLAGVLGTMRH